MKQLAYRIPDAATLIGVSRASIYNLVNAFPPSIRAGRCRLVERNAGLAWAEIQRRGFAA